MVTMTRDEAVLEFVNDLVDYAIILLDAEGRVLTWNAGAEAIFGYPAAEVANRRVSDFRTDLDVAVFAADGVLADAITWGRYETTAQLVDKAGRQVDAHLVLRPVRDTEHRLLGYGIVVRRAGGAVRPGALEIVANRGNVVALAGRARILVVDDDDLVLDEAAEQLSSLGYEVVTAASGNEALAIVAQDADFDMLFTDVVMRNGVGGAALAEQIRRIRPSLSILFASGYLREALESSGQLPAGVECIVKPYRKAELAEKVEGILAFRSQARLASDETAC